MTDEKQIAERWALANDDNFKHLLVWRIVKARAEGGGFNGQLISDYRKADAALEVLTKTDPPSNENQGRSRDTLHEIEAGSDREKPA